MYEQKIISPAWINRHGREEGFLLFEVGTDEQQNYSQEHLPGAVYLDTNMFEHAPDWNILPPRELEQALLTLGVTSQKTVALYGSSRWAVARTALVLLYAGVEDVRCLYGDKDAWKAGGYSLESGSNGPVSAATFGDTVPRHPEYIVSLEQVRAMLADPRAVVADVRTWDEHTGQVSGYSYLHAKGRIPSSTWLGEVPSNTRAAAHADAAHQQVLQAYREVISGWREKGVTPDRHVAFYCGTGWRASEAFWCAHVMGWEHISVYDGGWLEWSSQTEN